MSHKPDDRMPFDETAPFDAPRAWSAASDDQPTMAFEAPDPADRGPDVEATQRIGRVDQHDQTERLERTEQPTRRLDLPSDDASGGARSTETRAFSHVPLVDAGSPTGPTAHAQPRQRQGRHDAAGQDRGGQDAPTVAIQRGRLHPRQEQSFDDLQWSRGSADRGAAADGSSGYGAAGHGYSGHRDSRVRRHLGVGGWLRVALSMLLLLVGTLLLTSTLAEGLRDGTAPNPFTPLAGVGAGIVILAWIIVPGPWYGRLAAVPLSLAAHMALVGAVSLFVMQAAGMPTTDLLDEGAISTIALGILPGAALCLGALSWLAARGKQGWTVGLLVIPIVAVTVATLLLDGGWMTALPEWWVRVHDAIAPAVVLVTWPEELAAGIAVGADLTLRIAVVLLPVMLLAAPFGRRQRRR